MTKRLEQAISRLSPAELEQLTKMAEVLVQQKGSNGTSNWKFNWVGALGDSQEKSGVEAQRVAMSEWDEMIERGPSK